jgi:hypothetical protein
MESLLIFVPAFILAVLAGILLFGAGLYFLITRLFVSLSGINRLAAAYPAPAAPAGEILRRRTIQIGAVRWRNCVDIAATPEGLYLHVRQFATRFAPLLIPWSELKAAGETWYYWQRAKRLSVGSPAITELALHLPLYALVEPYLR